MRVISRLNGVGKRINDIDSRIRYTLRTKYRGGHRIHSPYVFNLVRELFMKKRNSILVSDAELTVHLCQSGLKYDYSYRIGQFFKYHNFVKYSINPLVYSGEDMIVLTSFGDENLLNTMVQDMRNTHSRSVVVVMNIYRNKECRTWWRNCNELSLDLYRLGIVIYDENLNKEYFKLKI